MKVYVHMYNGNVQQKHFTPLRTTYTTDSIAHKSGVYEVHSFQCTTVYPPYSQVACTQYAVYAFNYGDLCTQCTTFNNGVNTVYWYSVVVYRIIPTLGKGTYGTFLIGQMHRFLYTRAQIDAAY